MSLTVYTYPNKILRQKAKALNEVTSSIRDLADQMLETMYDENGIGLAAPQVGESIRLLVVDVPQPENTEDQENESKKIKPVSTPLVLINPVVTQSQGEIEFEEGCLSCPELIVPVERKAEITVEYLDKEGSPQTLVSQGLQGVCIQHEIDHLDGILLVDRLERYQAGIYRKKQIRKAKEQSDFAGVLK